MPSPLMPGHRCARFLVALAPIHIVVAWSPSHPLSRRACPPSASASMGGDTMAVDRGVLLLFLVTALVGFASASPSLSGPCGGPLRVGFLSLGINIERARARGMPRHWSLGSLDLWLWLMEWVVLPCMNLFVLVMIISLGKLFALSVIQLQFKTVFENTLMQHLVGLPPGSMGKISYIATAG